MIKQKNDQISESNFMTLSRKMIKFLWLSINIRRAGRARFEIQISGAAIPACGIGRVAQLVSFRFIYLDG